MTYSAPVDSDMMERRLRPYKEMADLIIAEMEATPKPRTVVYFIKGGTAVKIGIALDPERRRKELQTGNPERLELLFTIGGGRKKEKEFHRKYAEYAIGGEWFRYEGFLAFYIEAQIRRRQKDVSP